MLALVLFCSLVIDLFFSVSFLQFLFHLKVKVSFYKICFMFFFLFCFHIIYFYLKASFYKHFIVLFSVCENIMVLYANKNLEKKFHLN